MEKVSTRTAGNLVLFSLKGKTKGNRKVVSTLFPILKLLVEGTKTVVLVKAILKEERPYPKPIRSETDF